MVDWQIDANRPRRVPRSSLTWVGRMSRVLAGVAVVDVFFAVAVLAGGCRRGHAPRARRRRSCVTPRGQVFARAQNSTAGTLPRASYQILLMLLHGK